ncbi:RNA 3'-terminal phosphate cyclase [Halovenus marina]|uniref:RNA 3'-terminal phosphate cyclase n=1 Tax=Halovenus marina TaxID=3396621 RepID=UPI003F577041
MIKVDGDDGGGQLLRSSLALAALTDQPVEIANIRGNRPDPGLKPQHLAAVRALERLCEATVEGATLGSETITFDPDALTTDPIEIEIPTAGSLTLLFDAVLPLATRIDDAISVTATGGTEVAWSPPLATHERVKLPLCRRFGLQTTVERQRTGFYPAGGGRATLWLAPSTLDPLSLSQRGDLERVVVDSRCSADLAARDVAQRQAEQAVERLSSGGIDTTERATTVDETDSTGSAITVAFEYERSRAGFDALGEPGTPAEDIADEAVSRALSVHESDAVVDRYLADQLLLFLALSGGEIRIPEVTEHVETHRSLLDQFGFEIHIEENRTSAVVSAPGTDPGDIDR